MALKTGIKNVAALKLGASNVVKAYLGDKVVYQLSTVQPINFNFVYYTGDIDGFRRIEKFDLNTNTRIFQTPSLLSNQTSLVFDDSAIYVGGGANPGRIVAFNKNTGAFIGQSDFVNSLRPPNFFIVDGFLYFLISATVASFIRGINKLNLNNFTSTPFSTSYGDTPSFLDFDEEFFFMGGTGGATFGRTVDKITLSGSLSVQSPRLPANILVIKSDPLNNNVYVGAGNLFYVLNYNDLTITTSVNHGGIVRAIAIDENFIYVGGSTVLTVRVYNKTNYSLVLETPSYGGIIRDISVDDNFIYVVGSTTRRVRKYNKITGAFVSETNPAALGNILKAVYEE